MISATRKYVKTSFSGTQTTWAFGPIHYDTWDEYVADRCRFAQQSDCLATAAGWSPPKWWEYWRWDDQPRELWGGL